MLRLPEKYRTQKDRPPLELQRKVSQPVSQDGGKTKEVKFTFTLPPSLNEQYIKFRKGGAKRFALSEEAKAFEKNVKSVVGSQVYNLQGFPTGDREVVYELIVDLYFDKLENPGWFEKYTRGTKRGERKAVSRYKRLDTDNRIKFLQDRLCAAVGIPGDEQIFRVRASKFCSSNQRTEVTLRVIEAEEFFETRSEAS